MIFHNTGRDKAERTVATLDLNRIDLMERRGVTLKRIRELIDRLNATADAAHREFLRNAILTAETAAEKEYAACARSFVLAMEQARQF
jgi:DNA-binding transcriptional MerR regulator